MKKKISKYIIPQIFLFILIYPFSLFHVEDCECATNLKCLDVAECKEKYDFQTLKVKYVLLKDLSQAKGLN